MNKVVLVILLLICESAKSESALEFSSGVYGGYTLTNISNSIEDLDNKSAEGYLIGAEGEAVYKNDYLVGIKYQYSDTNYLEMNEIYIDFGVLFPVVDQRILSFYVDFLMGANLYRWKSIDFTVNTKNSTFSSNSFSYGGDIGLRSLLFGFLDLRLSYQLTALAKSSSYVDLQPENNASSASIVINNKSSFVFSVSYKFN